MYLSPDRKYLYSQSGAIVGISIRPTLKKRVSTWRSAGFAPDIAMPRHSKHDFVAMRASMNIGCPQLRCCPGKTTCRCGRLIQKRKGQHLGRRFAGPSWRHPFAGLRRRGLSWEASRRIHAPFQSTKQIERPTRFAQ